jgi:hypothetical protein
MPPAGEVAGAVADDAVGRQLAPRDREALREVEREAAVAGCRELEPLAVSLGAGVERDDLAFVP